MNTFFIIISTLISSFFFIKFFFPISINIGLTDRPTTRKTHSGQIPLIGGIVVFLTSAINSILFLPITQQLNLFFIASAMAVFFGALDDKYDVTIRIKAITIFIISSIMIYGSNIYISNFGNLLSFGEIRIGFFGVFATFLIFSFVIHSYTSIDGIDGQLASLSIVSHFSLAVLFQLYGNEGYHIYLYVIVSALIPPLYFNITNLTKAQNKIFMGEAGGWFLGLSFVFFATLGSQGESAIFKPITAIWLTIVPIMDNIYIIFRRISKGQSPFKPGRDHIHHTLQRYGFSSTQVLLIVSVLSIFSCLIGILGEILAIPEYLMFSFLIAYFILYFTIQNYFINSNQSIN